MAERLELQALLEELFGSEYVYYQPPANVRMHYPCIRYEKDSRNTQYADDIPYFGKYRYRILVIDPYPDNPVIEKLLKLRTASYGKQYISDGLYHTPIYIYY